ncbi:membrane dipeptidase [Prevotella sp. Rep29]|uniref:membrane dipeptidase n=1 Tax=Prevotella sp. Rep29 TaxID=2691580 RepID=UPI001C6F3C99|nr:membrane dipeptidase [Prevotella sp. Rep29]QYR11683.1 fused gamma-glutamyl-gamma-aminobutyrate hydrolase/peptidase [Prevotella sp. Rep29]
MESFDLQAHLDEIYSNFPPEYWKPVIGITANYAEGEARLMDRYYKQVVSAGGVPVLIPPVADKDVIINTLKSIDGLLLTGGGDINPLWSGEQPSPQLHGVNNVRDLPELLITKLAYNRQIPMLGICRGMQTLATALGGKVMQDIEEDFKKQQKAGLSADTEPLKHSQDGDRDMLSHVVNISEGSELQEIYEGASSIYVNSFHHQAVKETGPRFHVTATAPDGIIEAMESTEYKSVLGVQWHPEWLMSDGRRLFRWLVIQAREFKRAKAVHQRVLTLDTHCDTPMFFSKDIHFERRDPRILVDLQKMTEGGQDATTMVAYLPQPAAGATFAEKVPFQVQGPFEYANLIFDKVKAMINGYGRYVSIVRTPSELYDNKKQGRKSIMLGIENGLALEHHIENVEHFARRGIVYITLCHNGDNDLCDSARGMQTHGGMSQFGAEVIREMNRLGIMVDLSHAHEKSFYDALEISATPIVCSHSSCRALCDHPRNLTDDQMRLLASKGGVMQVTLYPGFLRSEGTATIVDAMKHLEHAIEVMGIDCVGLGTDFDGDGGVCGLADSSEMINFTRQLLRRKFNERDIQKIWGGNWLRVMARVQSLRQNTNQQ